ncbi:hypothetical protein HPB51_015088 [Rhipicephalus microplus]|uniref:Uncharacterized protein n=1 Tax=Rhipicephalus microplus TaxID=6941 RepID=A0A9J6ETE8_RHIMP|nr:hypothetical protein HPB51_015088 [Rhipicephalus microplus]
MVGKDTFYFLVIPIPMKKGPITFLWTLYPLSRVRHYRRQDSQDDDPYPDEIIPLICCTILLLLVIMVLLLVLVSSAYGGAEEDSGTAIGLRIDWDIGDQYRQFFRVADVQARRTYLQFPQADLYMGMWGMTYVRLLESLWTIQEINRSIYEFVRTPIHANINYTRFEGFAIINSIVRDNRGHHQANETYVYNIFKDPQYPILLPGWKFIHTMSIWPFWPVRLPLEKIVHVANFPDIFGVSTSNTTEEHNTIWFEPSYNAPVNWISPPNPIYRAHNGTRGMLDIIAEFPYWKQLLNQSRVCFSVTTSINYGHITSLPIDFHNELNIDWFNAFRFRRLNFTGINEGNKKLNVEDMDMQYEFENRSQSHMWVHRYPLGIVSVFVYDDATTLAPKGSSLVIIEYRDNWCQKGMVKKTVKCSGCGVGWKVDPSVEADGEEADAKCRQCEVEEKMEKMMVAQSELLMRIAELETALATEQEKTRAMGERLKSAEEALAKLNKEATYRENSREPATRTVEKEKQASLEKKQV